MRNFQIIRPNYHFALVLLRRSADEDREEAEKWYSEFIASALMLLQEPEDVLQALKMFEWDVPRAVDHLHKNPKSKKGEFDVNDEEKKNIHHDKKVNDNKNDDDDDDDDDDNVVENNDDDKND